MAPVHENMCTSLTHDVSKGDNTYLKVIFNITTNLEIKLRLARKKSSGKSMVKSRAINLIVLESIY